MAPATRRSLDEARARMVQEQLEARGVRDARVLAAMREVPRHRFVPAEVIREAYDDTPLPIGHDQTISQPYIVALMTELARPQPSDRALEIGTGSGYQAAVLSRVVGQVFTIEYVPALAQRAAKALAEYPNIVVREGDGYGGWPEHGPYDIILVTAAPETLPPALVDQLAPGGRLDHPDRRDLGHAGAEADSEARRWHRDDRVDRAGALRAARARPLNAAPLGARATPAIRRDREPDGLTCQPSSRPDPATPN